MDFKQVEILNGLFLGRANIDKSNERFQKKGASDDYADWIVKELDGLGVRESGNRVIAQKEDWIMKWRKRWYHKGRKYPSHHLKLTPLISGVWFEERGELVSHDRLKIEMDGILMTENAIRILENRGISSFESLSDIYIRGPERRKFLDWITPPDF